MEPWPHIPSRERPPTADAGAAVWRLLALAALISGFLCGVRGEVLAEAPIGKLESQVKAAFIVKFASFIEWPDTSCADTNTPFVIGILGRDPFGAEFDEAVKSERVRDRPVELHRSNQLEKLADCQILYLAGSELGRFEEIVASMACRPVLLVTDAPGLAQRGSQINFIKDDGKVRFEINVAAAEQAQLKFSAKLLQAGRIVVRPGAEERRNL